MFRRLLTSMAIATLALVVVAPDTQAELKIGYIDAETITANYKRFQDAQKEAKSYEEELTRDFNKQQNELARMQENFERQSLLMSEQRKKEEQQSIQRKQAELQKFLEEVSGQNGRLQRKTQELLQPIIQRVNEAIATVSKDDGFDLVLNTAAIAFANEELDLTQQVLEQLLKEDEAESKANAAGAGQ